MKSKWQRRILAVAAVLAGVLLAGTLVWSGEPPTGPASPIAVVDLGRIFREAPNLPPLATLQAEFDRRKLQLVEQRDQRLRELQARGNELRREKAMAAGERSEQLERDLIGLRADVEYENERANRLATIALLERERAAYQLVGEAAGAVARARGIRLILRRPSFDGPARQIQEEMSVAAVLYAEPGLDLTDAVLEALAQETP